MARWNGLWGAAVAAAMLSVAAGPALSEPKEDAKHAGKTAVRGTTAVGKGGSKVYHEAAKGVHKIISKNAGNKETKAKHWSKAQAHDEHAKRKAVQAEKQLDKTKSSAKAVGK